MRSIQVALPNHTQCLEGKSIEHLDRVIPQICNVQVPTARAKGEIVRMIKLSR